MDLCTFGLNLAIGSEDNADQYLCKFGPNLAIVLEDREGRQDMTLVTLKIKLRSPNLIINLGPPNYVSVPVWSKSGHWFRR